MMTLNQIILENELKQWHGMETASNCETHNISTSYLKNRKRKQHAKLKARGIKIKQCRKMVLGYGTPNSALLYASGKA